jgi:hypothetical protein
VQVDEESYSSSSAATANTPHVSPAATGNYPCCRSCAGQRRELQQLVRRHRRDGPRFTRSHRQLSDSPALHAPYLSGSHRQLRNLAVFALVTFASASQVRALLRSPHLAASFRVGTVPCQKKKCPPEPQQEVLYLVSFDLNKNRKCPPEQEQEDSKKNL